MKKIISLFLSAAILASSCMAGFLSPAYAEEPLNEPSVSQNASEPALYAGTADLFTGVSLSQTEVDPVAKPKLTFRFALSRDANCTVQVWSTTGLVSQITINTPYKAGDQTISWDVPQSLADGKYSFRVVSIENGKEATDKWADFVVKRSAVAITAGSVSATTVDPSKGGKLTCNFTLNQAATCAVQVWSSTGLVGYASGNRSFSAGNNSVAWNIPQNLANGKYSFRIVAIENGREVADRWVDFTAQKNQVAITAGSVSATTIDPSKGGKLTCNFTLNQAATCAVQVWSSTGLVGYASGNRSFSAGNNSVAWNIPQNLANGKYSFRIVAIENGREVADRWVDFTAKIESLAVTGGSLSTTTVDPSKGGSVSCNFTLNKAATCSVQVWNATGLVGYVVTNGNFKAGSNSVSWSVPQNLVDGKYSFRVVAMENGKESADRWMDFTAKNSSLIISNGSVSANPVNPGEKIYCTFTLNKLAVCSVQIWSSTGLVDYATIDTSYNAGENTVSWIVASTLSDGKYSFRVVSMQNGKEVGQWIDFEVKNSSSSISIDSYVSTLAVGETRTFNAYITPAGAMTVKRWYTNNNSVLKLEPSGTKLKITALSSGTATIFVESSTGLTTSCLIHVTSGSERGIDISKHQGTINKDMLTEAKNSGLSFVFIRASYGWMDDLNDPNDLYEQKDVNFNKNYETAKAVGLKVGAYHFSYATTAKEATAEVQTFLKAIDGRPMDMPVVYDIELNDVWDKAGFVPTKAVISQNAKIFCDAVRAKGYTPMIYASSSFYNSYIDPNIVGEHQVWVAHYDTSKPSINVNYTYWQYSSEGQVPGLNGNIDMNIKR